MYYRALANQVQGTGWQVALDYFQRVDHDRCVEVALSRVEVGRVIVKEHPDQYSMGLLSLAGITA